MKQLSKNKIIVASAGGRKTTHIVEEALKQPQTCKILITTYTIENTSQIKSYIFERKGYFPENIEVLTWYGFLLSHAVKPYQNQFFAEIKIKSIDFESTPPIWFE